ncbi:tol-pal system protein [Rhodobacteraceae bacterium WD3A24]|nr:tol-pal system protein [Rhodobacteraceae bacterium WD3A24]
MMRALLGAVALAAAVGLAGPVAAQSRDETLADIRQELSVLYAEVQGLRRELSTTQGPPAGIGGGSLLDRVDAIESELRRLIGRTEELEHRIDRIVADATNRIGDLEFRLVELEGGDVSELGETTTLGSDSADGADGGEWREIPGLGLGSGGGGGAAVTGESGQTGPDLAATEQDDFDAARAALDAENYREAARRFDEFVETYTAGPLTTEAHFLRARAREELGETSQAARAYLDAYSTAPQGQRADEALFRLAGSLEALGQVEEACVMLGELALRFPGSDLLGRARERENALGCN